MSRWYFLMLSWLPDNYGYIPTQVGPFASEADARKIIKWLEDMPEAKNRYLVGSPPWQVTA